MTIVSKTKSVSEGTDKIELDHVELPASDYNVKKHRIDFSSWECDFEIPKDTTFRREEIYCS